MHAQNFVVNQCSDRQHIESTHKFFPKRDGIPLLALFVKPIDLCDILAFVIPPKQKYVLWIFNFVREQKANALDRLFATIDVVSQEEVVRVGRVPCQVKKPEKVFVLSVDIAHDLDGRTELQKDWL